MTEEHAQPADEESARASEPSAESLRAAARARRLAEVFGDVLPETTRDDAPDPAASSESGSAEERWYAENRPPHHDRP